MDIGSIGIHGDRPWLVAPPPLDTPVLPGPVTQDRREDLQISAFMLTVALTQDTPGPVGVTLGDDPPDRLVSVGGRSWGFELTELTLEHVRADLARVRRLGRKVDAAVDDDPERFAHHFGRHIAVSWAEPVGPVPRDFGPTIRDICAALDKDWGCVGDDAELPDNFPETWPRSNGYYGEVGPFLVEAYPGQDPATGPTVSASARSEIRPSQALAALTRLIEAKDRPENDSLLVTCGLPDERGYRCRLDEFMFRLLSERFSAGETIGFEPEHLGHVSLHLWGTHEWVVAYQAPTDPPWPALHANTWA